MRALLSRIENRKMTADDFVGFVALETSRAGVPTSYVALRIQHVDRVIGDRLHEKPIAPLVGFSLFEPLRTYHPNISQPQRAGLTSIEPRGLVLVPFLGAV